jgi:hypothetical protein
VLFRSIDINEVISACETDNCDPNYFILSTGILDKDYSHLNTNINMLKAKNIDVKFICIDVANGYMFKLIDFCKKTNPGGPGWKKIKEEALKNNISFNDKTDNKWSVPLGIICMLLGSFAIYSFLFSTGHFIYGDLNSGISFLIIGISFALFLKYNWDKLKKLK